MPETIYIIIHEGKKANARKRDLHHHFPRPIFGDFNDSRDVQLASMFKRERGTVQSIQNMKNSEMESRQIMHKEKK